MRRLISALVLLLATSLAAAADTPDYDGIVKAYKEKQYSKVVRRAPEFLDKSSKHPRAHTIRYALAESLRQLGRHDEALALFEEYLRLHPDRRYADRIRASVVVCLQREERHAEAIERANVYLKEYPEGERRDRVKFWRARAIEEQRRFPEAAEALGTVGGPYAERAAYRRGVVWFRGREFAKARAALETFLAKYPGSSWERSAREYLFRTDADYENVRSGIVQDYDGKYESDPRLRAIRRRLPKLRLAAIREIEALLERKVPRTFLIRLKDAGANTSGHYAQTRLEVVKGEPTQVLVLYTEYLVLGAHDVERTLVHELYHCLQRESLDEDHFRTPKWAREGAALYVAGQAPLRFRLLAADEGRRPEVEDPMASLVDGLGGHHGFDDYAEDVSAFLSVEERYGRKHAVRLLKRLLTTPDVEAAVKNVLGEDFATFEREASSYARRQLEPLVEKGRRELHAALDLMAAKNWAGGLSALPKDAGVYSAAVVYYRAIALLEGGRPQEALTAAREYREKHSWFDPLLDNAIYVELKALKQLEDPAFPAAAERAEKDLEPTGVHAAVSRLLRGS